MTRRLTMMMAALMLSLSAGAQMVPWLTHSADNSRSNFNPHETVLTQQSVTTKGLRLQPPIPVIGDARGMEAQPLIEPNVLITQYTGAGGSTVHTERYADIMLLPSLANVVRGVDAQTGAAVWQTGPLCAPVKSTAATDMHQINDHVGILSTPVIDPDLNEAFMVAACSVDNTYKNAELIVYVLRMSDGYVVKSIPLPESSGKQWKQRSALTETNVGGAKTVFFAHGSVFETATGMTGGITAIDVASMTVSAELYLPEGIWMAGQGLVADDQGLLYAVTGNGDFDPSQGFYGESFIKVQYTPRSVPSGAHIGCACLDESCCGVYATLKVIDQWSPWSDYQRTGQKPPAMKMSGVNAETQTPVGGKMEMDLKTSTVTASIKDGVVTTYVWPDAQGAWSDEDWGSAGPACIFAIGTCVAAGKDGIGYPINVGPTGLGGTTATTVGTAGNYAKLKAPCQWLTAYGPGPCAPTNPQNLNVFINGDTAHLHMTPVQMYDPLLKSWTIFVWGENSQLHKWKVGNDGSLSYLAQSNEFASNDVRGRSPGGMPGGFCSGSSNGTDPNSYLLVCSIPYGDGNASVTGGRLLVYDPVHLNQDGTLKVLWDSQRWGITYTFNKFMPPVIDGGEIILPDYAGRVLIFE